LPKKENYKNKTNMNSTAINGTSNPLGMTGVDTHGSLYKIIGVTLAIASGK
jgi:hypothetical protein